MKFLTINATTRIQPYLTRKRIQYGKISKTENDPRGRRQHMNILIVCGGGASSSFIAQNVYRAGKAAGMDLTVDAISETELEDYVYDRDAILIGPHLKYLEENLAEICNGEGVPFAFISDANYGKMDGAAILEQAKELAGK